jgi:hypothetical protein
MKRSDTRRRSAVATDRQSLRTGLEKFTLFPGNTIYQFDCAEKPLSGGQVCSWLIWSSRSMPSTRLRRLASSLISFLMQKTALPYCCNWTSQEISLWLSASLLDSGVPQHPLPGEVFSLTEGLLTGAPLRWDPSISLGQIWPFYSINVLVPAKSSVLFHAN